MFAGKIQPTNTVRVLALPPAKFPVHVTSVTARVACSHRSSHPSALAPACAERSASHARVSAADLYTHLRWGYKYASLAGFLVYRQKIEVKRWMSS